jgi:transcriptional regulator with XRE-family HTH domain
MITRLKQLRKILDMNQTDFAGKLNMAQTSYSQIETGKNELTNKNIDLICLKFGVNEQWLRTGEGEIFRNVTVEGQELLDIFNRLCPEMQDFFIKMGRELLEKEKRLSFIPEKPETSSEPAPDAPEATPEPPQEAEILPYPEQEICEKRETPRTGPRLEDAPVG